MERLLGATIDPQVANALLEEAGDRDCPVKFDGFGRITRFARSSIHQLPPGLVDRLEAAIIRPLSQTNSQAPRTAARAERDLLVRALHLLHSHGGADAAQLAKEARQLFLSSSFSREAVAAFLKQAAQRLDADALLQDQFTKLHADASKPISMAQRVDNIHGRSFESFLIEDLVLAAPPGVLKAAHDVGEGMLDTLDDLFSGERDALMHELVQQLSADPRPWFVHSPSMQAFARAPSMATFAACLADTSTGMEAIKVVHLAQRFVLALNNVSERGEMARPRWYEQCLDFYSDFLQPQKPQTRVALDVPPQNPGNWLHYQPNASAIETPRHGMNWTHYRMPNPAKLSLSERDSLLRGQTVINGLSGQATMVSFFAQHLARNNPALSLPEVHLATMMCLVFDGGHSTEEVLATVDALKGFHSPEAVAPGPASGFRGGYEAIADLASDEADRQALRDRMDAAIDRMISYHAEHVS